MKKVILSISLAAVMLLGCKKEKTVEPEVTNEKCGKVTRYEKGDAYITYRLVDGYYVYFSNGKNGFMRDAVYESLRVKYEIGSTHCDIPVFLDY